MSMPRQHLLSFSLACAITAAGWAALWPHPQKPIGEAYAAVQDRPRPSRSHTARRTRDELQDLLAAIESAETRAERLEATRHLGQIPAEQIPEALELVTMVERNDLSHAAKALFVRWGSLDGEVAARWAWKNFGPLSWWGHAFSELGSSWAWSDPKGFGTWLVERVESQAEIPFGWSDEDAANRGDEPVLGHQLLGDAWKWILADNPAAAFTVAQKLGGWSSDWERLIDQEIQSVDQIREGLSAFGSLEHLNPRGTMQTGDLLPLMLLNRWMTLDPEGFAASPHAGLIRPSYKDIVAQWHAQSGGDRGELAERIVATADPRDRPARIATIVSEWSVEDLGAAHQWLESLPDQQNRLGQQVIAKKGITQDPVGTLQWITELPPAQRQACLVTAFDAWEKEIPGAQPDLSHLEPRWQQAWEDLAALEAVGAK